MDLHLSGKVAVISGGATGIGRAAAEEYMKEGVQVAVFGRRLSVLEEFAADAYQVLQILGRLPFDYVNIESGQYCCRETAAADYSSPQELLTDISRVF